MNSNSKYILIDNTFNTYTLEINGGGLTVLVLICFGSAKSAILKLIVGFSKSGYKKMITSLNTKIE